MKFDINKECKITLKDFNFNEKVFKIIACDISRGNRTSKESHDVFKTIKDNLLKSVINKQHVSSVISLDDKLGGVGKSKFLQSLKFLLEELEHSKVVLVSSDGLEIQEYIKVKDITGDIQRGKRFDVILVDDITEEELELIKQVYPNARIYGFIKEAKAEEETLYTKIVTDLKSHCNADEYRIEGNKITFKSANSISFLPKLGSIKSLLMADAKQFKEYPKHSTYDIDLVDFKFSTDGYVDAVYGNNMLYSIVNDTIELRFNFKYTPILSK